MRWSGKQQVCKCLSPIKTFPKDRLDSGYFRQVLHCTEIWWEKEFGVKRVKEQLSLEDTCNEYPIVRTANIPLDFSALHKSVSAPVLVVYGSGDFVIAPDLALKGFGSLKRVIYKKLSNSTHYGYQEEPDALASMIAHFADSIVR